jgi:hypothetical protein
MAWAASADFKILAYKDLPGSSLDNFASVPRRRFGSYEAATNHLQTCQAVTIPWLAPPQLQEYIASQFRDFGIDTSRFSSWRGLGPPKLTFYNRTVVDIHTAGPDTSPEETHAAQTEGPPPRDKVVGFKVKTPSISLSKASESPSASDADQFMDWGSPNEDVVHALERSRASKTKATKAHASLETPPPLM